MELQRFNFDNLGVMSKSYLDQMVDIYRLNDTVKRTDFINPQDTNIDVAHKAMLAQVSELGMDMESLAALVQRVIWLETEVRQLKRNNRNIRSKNQRLQHKELSSGQTSH